MSTHNFSFTTYEEPTDSNWYKTFEHLLKYIDDGNEFPNTTNKKFSQWIALQRKLYKNGKLREHRIPILEALTGWRWTTVKWQDHADELKEYVSDGNPFPSTIHPEFGRWITNQRSFKKSGKLSKDRLLFLESSDFWSWGK